MFTFAYGVAEAEYESRGMVQWQRFIQNVVSRKSENTGHKTGAHQTGVGNYSWLWQTLKDEKYNMFFVFVMRMILLKYGKVFLYLRC